MNTLRRISRPLVKAVAAGAVMMAAALPVMAATTAGAATGPTLTYAQSTQYPTDPATYGYAVVEQGSSGALVNLVGTGFAYNNGPVTITTNAPSATVSGAVETSPTQASVNITTTTATTPGFYSLTLTDSNGTVTLAKGLGIIAGPSISSITPATLAPAITETITINGAGFSNVAGVDKVYLTNPSGTTTVLAYPSYTYVSPGQISLSIPGNAAAGTWAVQYFDGVAWSNYGSFTKAGPTITGLTPLTGLLIPGSGQSTQPVTVTGTGFEPGATFTLGTGGSFQSADSVTAGADVPLGGTFVPLTSPSPYPATEKVATGDGHITSSTTETPVVDGLYLAGTTTTTDAIAAGQTGSMFVYLNGDTNVNVGDPITGPNIAPGTKVTAIGASTYNLGDFLGAPDFSGTTKVSISKATTGTDCSSYDFWGLDAINNADNLCDTFTPVASAVGESAPLPIGGTSVTLAPAAAGTSVNLTAGESITATNSASQSQTFTINTISGAGTLLNPYVLTFNQSSGYLFDVLSTSWTTPGPWSDFTLANLPIGITQAYAPPFGVDWIPVNDNLDTVFHSWLTLSQPTIGGTVSSGTNVYFGDTHITVTGATGLANGMTVTNGVGSFTAGTTIAAVAGSAVTLNQASQPTPPSQPVTFGYSGTSVSQPTGAVYGSPTSYTFNVTVFAGTTPGQLGLTITNVDGSTAYVPNILGIGEPGTLASAQQIVSIYNPATLGSSLTYGQNTIQVTTANYPLAVGNTVSLTEGGHFTLTGTVLAVAPGGALATVSLYVPSIQSTTLALAASSGATSIVVPGTGLGLGGTTLTFVNGASTFSVASGAVATNTPAAGYATITVAPLSSGVAAGSTVEFPYPTGAATLTITNSSTVPESYVTTVSGATNMISSVGFGLGGGLKDSAGGNVYAGGSVHGYLTMPGFNFGTGSAIAFGSTSGPAGVTGTVTPVNADEAYVTATFPAALSTPGSVTGSAVLAGGNQVTLNPAAGVTISLSAGGSITATDGAQTQTFTIFSVVGNVVTFTSNAAVGFPTPATSWTSAGITSTNPVNFSALVSNGSGGTAILGNAFTLQNGIALTGVTPAVLGAGATNVPVSFTGNFIVGGVYSLTSSNTGVTFSHVTVTGANTMTALASVASGAAAGNFSLTLTSSDGDGGATLPNASEPLTTMSVVAAPTITSVVTGASSLAAGGFTTVTITGTGFSTTNGDTIYVLAGSGENAGFPDTGTVNGIPGIGSNGTCNGAAISSTQIVCTLFVGEGASPGTDSFQVTDNVTGGTSNTAGSITITGVSATATAPSTVDSNYNDGGGSYQVTLSGVTVTPTVAAAMSCSATILSPLGAPLTGFSCSGAPTYASASSVNVKTYGDLHGFSGDTEVFTLVAPSGQSFDAPPVTILHDAPPSSDLVAVPNAPLVPGTSGNVVSIISTSTGFFRGWFMPSTTVVYSGSGVTITPVSVTPNTVTVSISVATSATVGGSFTVQTSGFGNSVVPVLTVGAGPTITSAPFSVLTGGTKTLTIKGTGFEFGAVVSAAVPGFATFGAATVVNSTTITVSVTVATNSGPNPMVSDLTVKNPDASSATLAGGLIITPNPAVTGGPYYVPTFSSGIQYPVTGTGFEAGMTCSSSNSAYTVSVVGVSATGATLWVTTTSAATTGTSATVTCTNPDGGTTTFTLNGGPAPTPPLTKTAVFGRPARVGGSTAFNIDGTNMTGLTVTVNNKNVTVKIVQNTATEITVAIHVKKGVKPGTATLTLSNANGTVHLAFSYKK